MFVSGKGRMIFWTLPVRTANKRAHITDFFILKLPGCMYFDCL